MLFQIRGEFDHAEDKEEDAGEARLGGDDSPVEGGAAALLPGAGARDPAGDGAAVGFVFRAEGGAEKFLLGGGRS